MTSYSTQSTKQVRDLMSPVVRTLQRNDELLIVDAVMRETVVAWHRRLVARKFDGSTYQGGKP